MHKHKHKHILCISFARSNSQFISVHVSVCYGFLFFLAHIDHIRSHIARCERIEKARNYVYTDSSTSKTVFITDIIDISGAYMAMDMNGFSIKLKALYLLFSPAPFFHFILSLSLSLSYFLSVFLYFASARSQNSILGRIKWENSTFKSKGFYLSFFFLRWKMLHPIGMSLMAWCSFHCMRAFCYFLYGGSGNGCSERKNQKQLARD